MTVPPENEESEHREVLVVSVHDPDAEAPVQELPALETAAQNLMGGGAGGNLDGKDRLRSRDLPDLLAKWCTEAVLDFLHASDVGRRVVRTGRRRRP